MAEGPLRLPSQCVHADALIAVGRSFDGGSGAVARTLS